MALWGLYGAVYPRVCGGTPHYYYPLTLGWGLSPRVRGNRTWSSREAVASGSIPACAGEPNMVIAGSCSVGVYPRVCGGTVNPLPPPPDGIGLSPRVRGNHLYPVRRCAGSGSIPACAGEPTRCECSATMRSVYPRVCGGTRPLRFGWRAPTGLSPRVRGNLQTPTFLYWRIGSIPACAGEPLSKIGRDKLPRVYPRVCGGTSGGAVQEALSACWGLSPRVRGNHQPGRMC